MDILTLGVNTGIIGAIIALTEVIKGFDKEGKLKRFYILIPTVLGSLAALFKTVPLTWQAYGESWLIFVGLSIYIFKAGKTTLLGK